MNKINIRGLIRELYPEMQYLIARHYTINGAFTYLCENNSLSVEVKAKLVRETYCNLKKELGNVAPKVVALSKLTEGKAPILQESIPRLVEQKQEEEQRQVFLKRKIVPPSKKVENDFMGLGIFDVLREEEANKTAERLKNN